MPPLPWCQLLTLDLYFAVSVFQITNGGAMGKSSATLGQAYSYLTQPEVRFLDAAVARLIPADDPKHVMLNQQRPESRDGDH